MKKSNRISILSSLIVFSLFIGLFANININNNVPDNLVIGNDINEKQNLGSSGTYEIYHTDEWLDNGNFDSGSNFWTNSSSGDITDVNASVAGNEGRYEVTGNQSTFNFYSDLSIDWNWNQAYNPNFPAYPDVALLNSSGASVSHYWIEGADQTAAVNWNRTLTMPINMSDYEITSASLVAVCNGSVQATPSLDDNAGGGMVDQYTGAVDVMSDSGVDTNPTGGVFQGSVGDYVRFYVLLSDEENDNVFEVAYNQTYNLGQDSPLIETMDDTTMVTVPEEALIFYLTTALSKDFVNFTVSVGMRIWCEDNFAQDADYFELLIIKSINLTFSYEKKIDQLTTLSWEQVGNTISGANIDITDATLNFEYKVDQLWPSTSPNSELRIIINGTQHSEVIKISSATLTYKNGKIGGFDVTSLIKKDVNISFLLQLFIADEFLLNSKIVISIDNISLQISYTETLSDTPTELQLYMNSDNKTLPRLIQIPIGETVNVTIYYNDSGGFIDTASVVLTGYGSAKNLTENGALGHYNYTIDTSSLTLGEHYFTVTASKYTYETQEITFSISVIKRNSFIDHIAIDLIERTSASIPWNETFDISITYNDTLTNNPIDGATVQLTGTSVLKSFSENGDYYNISLSSFELQIGSNYLTISATAVNNSLTSEIIIITVTERTTELDTYLNNQSTTTITIPYGEILNITAFYKDLTSSNFIDGVTPELRVGETVLYTFSKHPSFNQYNLTLNTSDIGVGINYYTIYAKQNNYSAAQDSITITVTDRETEMDVYLNQVLKNNIEVPWNDLLNITAIYKDLNLSTFIHDANVALKDGPTTVYAFTKHLTYDQYYLTLNTSDLGLGVHVFSVYGIKQNYTSSSESITITVTERETELNILLNGSAVSSKSVPWGDLLNITAIFNDKNLTSFIDGADVYLKDGAVILYTFTESPTLDQYDLLLNVSDLGIGVHALTVSAEESNYSTTLGTITISVTERATELDILLNGSTNTNIDIPWNDLLNITAVYKDDVFKLLIEGATISLKDGAVILYSFTRHLTYNQYYLTINATDLGLGTTALSVNAKQDNYSVAIGSITITVSERDTELIILLNDTADTYIEVPWNDFLNITAIFNDNVSKILIEGATVSLKQGSTVLYTFTRHVTYDQYFIIIDTSDFGVGVKSLTVYADQDNYTTALASITVAILNRDTYLNISLNGQDKTTEKALTLTSGEILNITAYYYDSATNTFIKNAVVNVTGTAYSGSLDESIIYSHYNISINTTVFGVGVVFLTVFAQQNNYSYVASVLTITITETGTDYELYLNGIDKTIEKTLSLTVNQTLIISFNYTTLIPTFLSGATVNLTGGIFDEVLTEEISNGTYWITLNSSDFNQGINFFNIFATKIGYQPQAILLIIEVIERETNMTLFLNGTDITSTPSKKIPIGEHMNFTIVYWDVVADAHVETANVRLIGEGLNLTFTEFLVLKQYTLIVDSNDLNQGINFLSITAQRNNYKPHTLIVSIEVIEKKTDYNVFLNTDNVTLDPTLSIAQGATLNITMKYFENGSRMFIQNANISIVGSSLDDNLTQSIPLEQYSIIINTNQLSLGVNFISLYATKDNYQSQSVLLVITVHLIYTDYDVILNNVSKTADPTLSIAQGASLNITMKFFEDGTSIFILNANISIVGGGINDNLTQSIPLEQYSITINTDQLSIGVNIISLYATRDNYQSQLVNLVITVHLVYTDYDVYLNNESKKSNPSLTLFMGEMLNVTLKYFENGTTTFVPNANVTIIGGINDNLTQSIPFAQYFILINSSQLNPGVNFLSLYATKNYHESKTVLLVITLVEITTAYDLYLNGVNKTLEKSITLPIGSMLNITFKFLENGTSNFIENATLTLTGEGLNNGLTQSLQQYSILIDTSLLSIKPNLLSILAQKTNYKSLSIGITVSVREIAVTTTTDTGEPNVRTLPGEGAKLKIVVKDESGNPLTGATVRYTWAYGQGILTDTDNDGVYEVTLEVAPSGSYTLTITVFKGSNYQFKTYEITVTVQSPGDTGPLIWIVGGLALGLALLAGGFIAYQRKYKVPRPVRRTRKYRKNLNKGGPLLVTPIVKSDEAFNNLFKKETVGISTMAKAKGPIKPPVEKSILADGVFAGDTMKKKKDKKKEVEEEEDINIKEEDKK